MAENNNIPKHWEIKKLGEVCDKISLNGIKIKQKDYLAVGKFPVIDQGQEIIGGYFNDEKLVVPTEPPYIIFGDHTKVKKFINFKFIAGADGVKVLKPHTIYDPKFFFFLISTVNIPDKGYARHFQFLEKEEIPLPPLHEQLTIVSKIEELLSDLENGKQQLQTAQQQLKVYRQSLLKWAFEGKLTRLNHDPPDLHYEHDLNIAAESQMEYIKNQGSDNLPKGWKWAILGEICAPNRKCSYGVLVPGENVENGIILLRVGDIDDCGKIDQSKMKKISPAIASKFKRTFLKGGEVVISLVGAIGRTAVVPNSLIGANTARAVGVIPVAKNVSAKFVELMLRSPNKIKEHNDCSHEVARKTLNLEDVVKSKIPLPSFEEQQRIVEELESKLTVCDKIEETISQSLQQAETLWQSILKKAFEGKLVKKL